MGKGTAIIKFDDAGNLDLFGNNDVLAKVFGQSSQVDGLRVLLSDFETFTRCCPSMVTIIGEMLPKMPEYAADLPAATIRLMQEGKLFLRPDKQGKLLSTLVNADTSKIDQIVRLKEVQHVPAVNDMMFSLSFMAITQQLNQIQESIAEIREAQIHDRETKGMVAAQNLQWAAIEANPVKREQYCLDAHKDAMEGFFACLHTVEESSSFFLKQPADRSLMKAMAKQLNPLNIGKTLTAATQMKPKTQELRRSIGKCTYCTQYAAASSFLRDDKVQAVRDLEMYSKHMSRLLLGENEDHLRAWLSTETRQSLPKPLRGNTKSLTRENDVLGFVGASVKRISELSESEDLYLPEPDAAQVSETATEE